MTSVLFALLVAAGGSDDSPDLFQGFLVAATANDVYAPEFSFRVSGWNSNWGRCKILELAPDGKQVKQGDTIARFEFGARDALPWINDRIRRTAADGASQLILLLMQDINLIGRTTDHITLMIPNVSAP